MGEPHRSHAKGCHMTKKNTSDFVHKELYVFYANSIPFNGYSVKSGPLGGAESAVVYLSRELARLGKRVVVFTQTQDEGFFDNVEYKNCAAFPAFVQRTIFDVFVSVRDVEIFKTPIYARLRMLWMHDAHDQPHVRSLSDHRVLASIDKIITLSQWQTEQIKNVFSIPDEKFFISRNGVNKAYFKKYYKKRKKRLVYTSTPFRGLDVLLDCFPLIRKQVPDVELAVFSSMKVYGMSSEDDQERFGDVYERCKQDGVYLYGSVKQEELARKLAESYLFVYPNHFAETSCIAALEAQAAGTPCVASANGALGETICHGKTGMIISGDVCSDDFKRDFVDGVVRYLQDEQLWAEHSQAGREWILETHNWQTIAEEWSAEFDTTRPMLSVCMIVKNEEHMIGECLNKIASLADEIIVVDTGSHDQTVAIANTYDKVTVYTYEWNNDFAAARNFSLKKATGDWILVLDADERIATCDFAQLRTFLNVRQCVAYKLLQRSYIDDASIAGWRKNDGEYEEGADFAGYHESFLVRLFRADKGFAFEGAVHETIENSIFSRQLLPTNTTIPIHHFGKTSASIEKKGSFYLAIGKEKIQQNPRDPQAYKEVAIQCAELAMHDEAIYYYEKTLELNRSDVAAMSDLAVLFLKENQPDKARAYLDQAIATNKRFIPAYINLALLHKAFGELPLAKKCLEQALQLDKKHPLVWKELGMIHAMSGKFAKACEYFYHVKTLSKVDYMCDEIAYGHYELGKLFLKNNDFVQAEKSFHEAVAVKQAFPEAMNSLGVTYVRNNKFDEAKKMFSEVIAVCGLDERYRQELVNAYVNLGYIENYLNRFDRAVQYLTKAIEYNHHEAEAYNHLGIAKCGLGDLDEALSFFEKALEVNPQHDGARVNLQRVNETLVMNNNYASQRSSVAGR